MLTSELSDALNPHASQYHSRISSITTEYLIPVQLQPQAQAPQQSLPHRSELELAISEPSPPLPPRPEVVRTRPQTEGVQAVQELLRIVSATREAQEIERKRRLTWEREQEAKAAKRQAEMDRKLLQMRQEIVSLRGALDCQNSSKISTSWHNTPLISDQAPLQPVSPVSPNTQASASRRSIFVQGSSSNPYPSLGQPQPSHSSTQHPGDVPRPQSDQVHIPLAQTRATITSVTPTQSPQSISVSGSPRNNGTQSGKKRQNSALSGELEDDGNSSSNSSGSRGSRPHKRVNHHDKRCLTVQHAMRAHFWRMLEVDDEKLPESHIEGHSLEPTEPVRFVWDKTTKQSVHNSRMKVRILTDIKENRQRYKHVPRKDFGKKILDSAFEQCFTTFRQKYRAQNDASVALQIKKREELKARKARHASRRKMKLTSRSEARMNIQTFEHVIFDAAFQVECMSSEESDVEDENAIRSPGVLITRGYAWRSARLQRFYSALDQEEISDKSAKPKRGIGKRDRLVGPPKEDAILPPKGVATWMISRRWFKAVQHKHQDLPDVLKGLVNDSVEFDWASFHTLGEETEVSDTETHHLHYDSHRQTLPHQYSTAPSSLNYAFLQ